VKVGLLVAAAVLAVNGLDGLLDGLNVWVELGLKFAALAAAVGGAWRWLVGPGWRKVRAAVVWAHRQLELIGELRERLHAIETRLDQGHEHFERLDSAIESLASEEARAIRRSLQSGEPVQFTDAGGVDRRES
jgi:hypothetical protein